MQFDISDKNGFQKDVIEFSQHRPVVFLAWASWCGPCKLLKPKLLALQKRHDFPIVFFSVDDSLEFARELKIRGVPTVMVFSRGVEITRFSGDKTEDDLRNALMKAGAFNQPIRVALP